MIYIYIYLYISIVHSFLFLCSRPGYLHTIIHLSVHSLKDILVFPDFFLIRKKDAINMKYSFCVYVNISFTFFWVNKNYWVYLFYWRPEVLEYSWGSGELFFSNSQHMLT